MTDQNTSVVCGLFGTGTDTDSDALAVWCPDEIIERARGRQASEPDES